MNNEKKANDSSGWIAVLVLFGLWLAWRFGHGALQDLDVDRVKLGEVFLLCATIFLDWMLPIVLGLQAAKRKGYSPAWMLFGIHPGAGWIAFVVLAFLPARTGYLGRGVSTQRSLAERLDRFLTASTQSPSRMDLAAKTGRIEKAASGPLWASVFLAAVAFGVVLGLLNSRTQKPTSYPDDPATKRTTLSTPTTAQAHPLTTEEIANRSEHAVALIRGRHGGGTGFLVGRGLLATNSHVIALDRTEDLHISFPSAPGIAPAAHLLFEDPKRNLALLAVSTDLAPLEIEPAHQFHRGREVTVLGNPGFGHGVLENAVSRGVVSTSTIVAAQRYYQLSISINPGNSGGPVIDPSGRVIGVVTLKARRQEGIAFCIPADDLLAAIALVKQGDRETTTAFLVHRARYLTIWLDRIGAHYGQVFDAMLTGMDLAVARRLNPNLVIGIVQREDTATLHEFDVIIADEIRPEIGRIVDDQRIAMSIRDDLIDACNNCLMMRGAIKKPTGTTDTYRAYASTLRVRHRNVIKRLLTTLNLTGS